MLTDNINVWTIFSKCLENSNILKYTLISHKMIHHNQHDASGSTFNPLYSVMVIIKSTFPTIQNQYDLWSYSQIITISLLTNSRTVYLRWEDDQEDHVVITTWSPTNVPSLNLGLMYIYKIYIVQHISLIYRMHIKRPHFGK